MYFGLARYGSNFKVQHLEMKAIHQNEIVRGRCVSPVSRKYQCSCFRILMTSHEKHPHTVQVLLEWRFFLPGQFSFVRQTWTPANFHVTVTFQSKQNTFGLQVIFPKTKSLKRWRFVIGYYNQLQNC